ncbi:MAG: molecular chaperone TorD family protein [Geminicoccaceae bacterium]|nr:molecular chaperone TorD family protein [Geminicoccaceae bacterium]
MVPSDARFCASFSADLAADLRAIAREMGLEAEAILREFEESARNLGDPVELQRLYAALFLVPPAPVALNTGIYLDGTLLGPSERELNRVYERLGFRLDPGFRDLADHPSAQFEVLAALFERAAQALARGEENTARAFLREAGDFLAAYPRRWITPFAAALERSCSERGYNPCYLWLARFLWLAIDHELVHGEAGWHLEEKVAPRAVEDGNRVLGAEDLAEIAIRLENAGLSFEHLRSMPEWKEESYRIRRTLSLKNDREDR